MSALSIVTLDEQSEMPLLNHAAVESLVGRLVNEYVEREVGPVLVEAIRKLLASKAETGLAYKAGDAARMLGVSRSTLWRLDLPKTSYGTYAHETLVKHLKRELKGLE